MKFNGCLEGFWKVPDGCLQGNKRVLEGIKRVSEGSKEVVWKMLRFGSVQDRHRLRQVMSG